MTSLYDQSVPQFIQFLDNLRHILKKGAAFAEEKGTKPESVIQHRLIEDMRALEFQVQACCNTVVLFVDRVGKLPHASVEDNEETFEQLFNRIDRTIDYLQKVDPAAINANAANPVEVTSPRGKFGFNNGAAYLSRMTIPNFYFHLSIGYCILRAQGVQVGSLDFLKDVFVKIE